MLIGMMGPRTHGKTTVANHLVDTRGFHKYSIAGPLKDMLRAIGLTEDQVAGKYKQVPQRILQGKTPVQAMQTLGTEWGRRMIGEDFWAKLAIRNIRSLQDRNRYQNIVVDDLRFPNEVEAIILLGGVIWTIYDPRKTPGRYETEFPSCHPSNFLPYVWDFLRGVHASERFWRMVSPNVQLFNNSTLEDLYTQVDKQFEGEGICN